MRSSPTVSANNARAHLRATMLERRRKLMADLVALLMGESSECALNTPRGDDNPSWLN